jgi:SAM-dependent methyltransferase
VEVRLLSWAPNKNINNVGRKSVLMTDTTYLECINCRGALAWNKVIREIDSRVDSGLLQCVHCNSYFPVINGVGLFFTPSDLERYLKDWELEQCRSLLNYEIKDDAGIIPNSKDERRLVSEYWEYQWTHFSPLGKDDFLQDTLWGENIFNNFIPVEKKSFADKVVFVAGGGSGREAFHISNYRPAKIIVNDIGAEIYDVGNLFDPQTRKKIILIRNDLVLNPLKSQVVDVAICDHALQHVWDYRKGFEQLCRAVKKEAIVSVCVYSRENNFVMTHMIEPLKIILKRFPLKLMLWLALIPATLIYLIIKLFYKPLNNYIPSLAKRMPLNEHMMFWSKNSFKIIWCSCFDLIHAPIAYYFKKAEILDLAQKNEMKVISLGHTFGTTWSLVAKKL